MITATLTQSCSNQPSFNEWMKEFKVSSRYVEPKIKPERFIVDMTKLKASIKERQIETVN